MNYTPVDILNHVKSSGLEYKFMNALAYYKMGYSIGEITDREYIVKDNVCRMKSPSFSLNLKLDDEEIVAALKADMYVSAFICRKDNDYSVHFLVHKCRNSEKSDNEEAIAQEVVDYMILRTIVALRLDSYKKVDEYIG